MGLLFVLPCQPAQLPLFKQQAILPSDGTPTHAHTDAAGASMLMLL